jgi:hypothetical protein
MVWVCIKTIDGHPARRPQGLLAWRINHVIGMLHADPGPANEAELGGQGEPDAVAAGRTLEKSHHVR